MKFFVLLALALVCVTATSVRTSVTLSPSCSDGSAMPCSGVGTCVEGACQCVEGYTGPDCGLRATDPALFTRAREGMTVEAAPGVAERVAERAAAHKAKEEAAEAAAEAEAAAAAEVRASSTEWQHPKAKPLADVLWSDARGAATGDTDVPGEVALLEVAPAQAEYRELGGEMRARILDAVGGLALKPVATEEQAVRRGAHLSHTHVHAPIEKSSTPPARASVPVSVGEAAEEMPLESVESVEEDNVEGEGEVKQHAREWHVPERAPCANDCSGQGVCVLGVCQCFPRFTGADCATPMRCPNACSGRGECRDGRCVCRDGTTGAACELKLYL